MTASIRPASIADAGDLAALYASQRSFLAPFEPDRGEAFYTPAGQRARLADLERRRGADGSYAFVILEDGAAAGMAILSNVVRGAFRSANLGYWVAQERNGRGVATTAVGLVLEEAFGPIGLHRVEAGTLVDNLASQRVLARNRFRPIGLARAYLAIAGAWRDHILFARTVEDDAPPPAGAEDVAVSARGDQLEARRGNELVGTAAVGPPFSIEVAVAARRTGVGSALVAACVHEAGRTGAAELHAEAPLADAGLLVFLQRHGFVARGVSAERVTLIRPL
jgi:[ribosomal protein S5]-alanine N-acetyltransferase